MKNIKLKNLGINIPVKNSSTESNNEKNEVFVILTGSEISSIQEAGLDLGYYVNNKHMAIVNPGEIARALTEFQKETDCLCAYDIETNARIARQRLDINSCQTRSA